MALTKTPPAIDTPATDAVQAVKPVGTFESMDETTTNKVAANEALPVNDTAAAAPAPAAQPAASPATAAPASTPVVQRGGALATRGEASAFQNEVEAMKGGADFSYGNYAVFKGISGNIKGTGDNKTSLGPWVKVSMIAWDDRVQVSPGSDADAAKNCVAYSKDGVTVDSVIGFEKYGDWVGKKLADYIIFLKDNDFPGASASRFIDVACVVHEGASGASKELAGEIICISLSKSSIPSFSQYQEKLNMKAKAVARGIPGVVVPADPFTFYFIAEATSGDIRGSKKDWTKLKVSDKLKLE